MPAPVTPPPTTRMAKTATRFPRPGTGGGGATTEPAATLGLCHGGEAGSGAGAHGDEPAYAGVPTAGGPGVYAAGGGGRCCGGCAYCEACGWNDAGVGE